MMKLLRNRSLSFKLVLLFFFTVIAMVVVLRLTSGGAFVNRLEKSIRPHIQNYYQYLNKDIGIPPNLEVAKQLSESLKLNISIEGPDINWSSNGELAPERFSKIYSKHLQYFQSGHYRGHFAVRLSNPPYTTTFISHRDQELDSPWKILFHTLLGVLSVLGLLYFLLRRMISPIKEIQTSVKRIGAGELDHRINIQRKDELGKLSTDINAMADDVENMLEAKRQLLLAISHELRSPITRAKVAISLMDDNNLKLGLADDLKEMEIMVSSLLEAEQLNHRHQVLNLSKIDINVLIIDVINTHFPNKLIQQKLQGKILVSVDVPRFQFVIKNLLDNALKYCKQDIVISSQKTKLGWLLVVEDKGVGIPQKHLPHLTEPFYRVDPSRDRKTGGYGLGLYIIKMIVEAHQGKLIIDSEEDVGTKVTIKV